MLLKIEDIRNTLKLNNIDITGIFHVGAHDCEEIDIYKQLGIFPESIIWIDALEDKVIQSKLRGIPNVYTATISDKDDEDAVFNISNNVMSSSILEFGTHAQEHPDVVYIGNFHTKTITVDSFFKRNNIDNLKYNFWNFDIQGAELLALKGAINSIKNAKAIYLEVNTKHLYRDCPLLSEIDSFLSNFNFKRVLTTITPHSWGDALYIIDNSVKQLLIDVDGGLGNKLFQMAAATSIAKETDRMLVIQRENLDYSPHSNITYSNTIFKNFVFQHLSSQDYVRIEDKDSYIIHNWKEITNNYDDFNIRIKNYFQHWKYVSHDFCNKLSFNTDIVNKYPDIASKTFIHIRGGDYINYICVDLNEYYKKALLMFSENTDYVIFTNDIPYTLSRDWLPINFTIINENEIDSLYLMSKCKSGITANSTFSWWGAFLNRNRKLILPSHYFQKYVKGTSFHFPEATIVDV